ncbi:MAG: hypothetical protein JWQ21_4005 [Herminiimonas sp.]|nr:hypothetical protein [Herminiimonas sp.]
MSATSSTVRRPASGWPGTLPAGTGLAGLGGEKLASAQTVSFTTADGAWRTAQLIETDNAGDASSPQIAVDAGGNALAVWQQFDGTTNNIWSNRFD